MYIDYIILGIISVAVVIWAYTRLPGDDDSDGGQLVSVPTDSDDPSPVASGPREPAAPASGDGAAGDDGSPETAPSAPEPSEPAAV